MYHIADSDDSVKLEPSMGIAYLVYLAEALGVIALTFIFGYLVPKYMADLNVLELLTDSLGIKLNWLLSGLAFVSVIYSVFKVNSMKSYDVEFDGSTLTYEGGGLLKVKKSVSADKIVRVNMHDNPLGFGDVTIELTGEKEKDLIVQFVPKVEDRVKIFNAYMEGQHMGGGGGTASAGAVATYTADSPEPRKNKISFEKEVQGYIEDELAQGYGLDQIKEELLKEEYPEETINKVLKKIVEENTVSDKDKTKKKDRTDAAHLARRFHLPIMSITAVIMALIVLFFFAGIGQDSQKDLPDKIDIFLYDNLGLTVGVHNIISQEQIFNIDENVQTDIAKSILRDKAINSLIGNIKLSNTVTGYQKRGTRFTITDKSGFMETKTLIELRFQTDRDMDKLKIVESIPSTIAQSDNIILTQGGVFAEKDPPIILFTFNDLKAGESQKAVYVLTKDIERLDTITFAAEEKVQSIPEPKVCGDGKCVEGESYMTCCTDCGCAQDFVCDHNSCVAIPKDTCTKHSDCYDEEYSTKDLCTGTPKRCENTPITECIDRDYYCPEGCTYENDDNCEPPEEIVSDPITPVDESDLNITGPQESPDVQDMAITPEEALVGDDLFVEGIVVDPNGKDDIVRVWFEVLELAQTHGEMGDMIDDGTDPDVDPDDDIYTGVTTIQDFYLTGWYHVTVFAEDRAGNKKKMQRTFRVVDELSEETEE